MKRPSRPPQRPDPGSAVAGLMQAIDRKHWRLIARAVDEFVTRHAEMLLEYPERVTLFAEDFDSLDADGRHSIAKHCGVKLVRGPSREEYRL